MLNGKTALVTGSTSGIGLGIAEMLARQGANVVLNGLGGAEGIEDLRQRLAAAHRIASPAGRAKLLEIGAQPVGGPPERIAAIIASESPKWKRLIEQTNTRPD